MGNMAWQPPEDNHQEMWERLQSANQRIEIQTGKANQVGAQIDTGTLLMNTRFMVIFDMLEEMGWPRKLMDVMIAEKTADLLEQNLEGIEEKARQARLAAQAQGQDVVTPGGIVLPGAKPPPGMDANGQPPR